MDGTLHRGTRDVRIGGGRSVASSATSSFLATTRFYLSSPFCLTKVRVRSKDISKRFTWWEHPTRKNAQPISSVLRDNLRYDSAQRRISRQDASSCSNFFTNSLPPSLRAVFAVVPREQVLLELKEYAQEVDVEFVRKAVRAIGRCAIKLERAAERCINVLLELIETKVNYVLQEAVIVIKVCASRVGVE